MVSTENLWERERSEYGPDLKLFRARFDYMKNPRNAKTERMIVLESNDSVNVVALTKRETMLFVRQYRFGIEEYTLELPGGILNEGEQAEAAAWRELQEETGYTGKERLYLGKVASNPVYQNSWIHHYLIQDVELTHELSLDDGEEINVVEMPVEDVWEKLHQCFFTHPHTVSGLLCFFSWRKQNPAPGEI